MHIYIVLKAVSVSPYQQPADLPLLTGTAFSPSLLSLVGSATGCCCPADGQSYLCSAKGRWHTSVVSPLGTLRGWRVLGCAAGHSHCPSEGKKWWQDCNAQAAHQYTASQVPQMWTAWVSTTAKQQVLGFTVGKGDFHRDGFWNLATAVLKWLCFRQLCFVWMWH